MFILQIAAYIVVAYCVLFVIGAIYGFFVGVEKAPISHPYSCPEKDLRDWQRENGYL